MSKYILRKLEVQRRTSMGKTQLGEAIRRGIFPKGVPSFEDGRALGWFSDEIDAFIESRREARDAAAAAAPPRPKSTKPAPSRSPLRRRSGSGGRGDGRAN
jgi:predicted DNA-binding transcriptional regulator AlpA